MIKISVLQKFIRQAAFALVLLPFTFSVVSSQTEQPPEPSAPKSVTIPAVRTAKLANGMTVAVVQRPGVPLVSINLLVEAGARFDDEERAGLADLTASLLTKGTKTRTATQIAEAIEFLGADLRAAAGWNAANISMSSTSDKTGQALAIMADVVRNPVFSQSELVLAKSQALDGLASSLKQPSFLANYVASKFAFDEHPAGGTPDSIERIDRKAVKEFYDNFYDADGSTLIFAGDITLAQAKALAMRYFGGWKGPRRELIQNIETTPNTPPDQVEVAARKDVGSILVIDLPKSGQAAVNYVKKLSAERTNYLSSPMKVEPAYYSGIVLNSVLGGGYSSRLNYEIRIKRGLSYGAGSGITWRFDSSNFSTRAQTKNESAPEVASLVLAELQKLVNENVATTELVPRKSVLTGSFGRSLETTDGLANALADLMVFNIPTTELNAYISKVNQVSAEQIRSFASDHLLGGDIIIVGDYSVFKDDLAKRFPGMKVDVIKADELDLSKDNLRK